MDIKIEIEKIDEIIKNLNVVFMNINQTFDHLNNALKNVDGTTETWNGQAQEAIYRYYLHIASSFPVFSDKCKEFIGFTIAVSNRYKEFDNSQYIKIENNTESLDLNV